MSHMKVSSYPPIFRPAHLLRPVNYPSDHPVYGPDLLPVIDMAYLDHAKLHVACTDWGMFRLVNHGIPEDLITSLLSSAKSLFDLPFESKPEIFKGPNPVYSWGNSALTVAGVQTPAGLPEAGIEIITFAVAPPADEEAQETAITPLRNILEEYREHMTTLAQVLFKAMARNLNLVDENLLAKDDLNKYLDESSRVLRVNRYPPCSTSDDIVPQVRGLDAHTDSSLLTILLQDDVNGLELLKDGLWLPVKPIPNTLIVNLGDMLQAMSDDEYKSVEHKVKLNKVRERMSVAYFVFPEENTMVSGSKGKYRPFTCSDFRAQVQVDVAKTGWKVGLSRFRA